MSDRATIRYTYQDYLSTPEDPSRRYEIVDGELHVSATPRYRHQEVVGNLLRILTDIVRSRNLGEVVLTVGVHLHDELVLEPDVVFVRRDRLEIVDREGHIHGAPDLVVEVLSPSNRSYDRDLKRKRYLENGVAEVWIVDADEGRIEVWKPGQEEPLLPTEAVQWDVAGEVVSVPLVEVFRGWEPGEGA